MSLIVWLGLHTIRVDGERQSENIGSIVLRDSDSGKLYLCIENHALPALRLSAVSAFGSQI